MKHIFLSVAAVAMLSGCSSKPAPDLYVLRAPDTPAAACLKSKGSITVDRPLARDEYDGKRFVVMRDRHQLTHYTGAAWASPFPEQLQAFLTDRLTGQLTDATDEAQNTPGYRLRITIHEAAVIGTDAPVVRLRLSGSWRSASGTQAARFKIDESVPAAANHMADIVEAYNEAATAASDKMARALASRCR